MLSRPDQPLRLIIVGLKAAHVIPALEQVRWRGSYARFAALHEGLADLVSGYALSVDIAADGVQPRIGLECYLGREGANTPATLATFMDRCVALDLALPEKASTIAHWPGLSLPERVECTWPANLTAAQAEFGLRSSFARQVNHFKLVYADDRPPEVKAYFGLSHLWLRTAQGDNRESHRRP
jgi:hypothetical protein